MHRGTSNHCTPSTYLGFHFSSLGNQSTGTHFPLQLKVTSMPAPFLHDGIFHKRENSKMFFAVKAQIHITSHGSYASIGPVSKTGELYYE